MHFEGSTTNSPAGKLDISRNLLRVNGHYAGTRNTPVGMYTLIGGTHNKEVCGSSLPRKEPQESRWKPRPWRTDCKARSQLAMTEGQWYCNPLGKFNRFPPAKAVFPSGHNGGEMISTFSPESCQSVIQTLSRTRRKTSFEVGYGIEHK
jgi:hypothetical protein